MLFLAGPRQVGKTTISQLLLEQTNGLYLNWDNPSDRLLVLGPYQNIIDKCGAKKLGEPNQLIIFDEVHKYKDWKNHIKGFYDQYKNNYNIVVTGSAKLDIYHKGADSLMGRYFPYTIHPLSLRECLDPRIELNEFIQKPIIDNKKIYERLFEYGGFPDPFIQQSPAFSQQWQSTRFKQLIREDLRDLSLIQDIAQLEVLAQLLQLQAGQLCSYNSLSNKIRVSDQTIRRWISLLEATYFCFAIRPWTKNVSRSLLKEPKIYLWDWSVIDDKGAKFENFIACHLQKYIYFLTETGCGKFKLHFLRDKEKREVDFLVVKNDKPWLMVETKFSDDSHISSNLKIFQNQIQAKYVFQVAHNMPYVDQSCFEHTTPIIVPARTFLSQLI
jgi:uncharacterized protein